MASLLFLHRIDIQLDDNRLVVWKQPEQTDLFHDQVFDLLGIVLAIEFYKHLFDVEIFNPRNHRVFRTEQVLLEDGTEHT